MPTDRRRPPLAVAVVVTALLAGCGTDPPARPAPSWSSAPAGTGSTPAAPDAPAPTPAVVAGMGPAPVDCPDPRPAATPASALDPLAASYLGRDGDDTAEAVDVSPRCEIVLGGRFTGTGGPVTTIGRGGPGALVRLDGTGRRLLGTTRLAGRVTDLEIRPDTGDIAVATDRGVLLLDPAGTRPRWQRGGSASRVAVGVRGTVAAVTDSTVTVYDARGGTSATIRPSGRTVTDVAVDDRHGLVLVSGFRQVQTGPCVPVQIAFLHAYDRRGELRWRAYDHPADRLGDRCADSRADRVALGRDGKLYLAGETAGGNSIFGRSAADPDRPAPNVTIDKYTEPFNTSSAHHTYLARFEPATGRQLAGQFLLTRIDSKGDRGNTVKPYAITADERGRIYAGGVAAYRIADRDRVRLGGRRLDGYAGGDAWVLVLSADLKRRTTWTVFTDGGAGEVRGVAVGPGVAAVAARVDEAPFHRVHPVQSGAARAGGAGYVAAWPALPD